jgi:REP element-mobilizing transposase RayT
MPRKMRVEECGYHHVINRGVARSDVFLEDLDKEKFLNILISIAKDYRLFVHSFCLMDNHYHLLVENRRENLSTAIQQLNAQYAMYFNKKYKRSGHLWQGRFNSYFIFDETYLFTLFKYIETNPLKANISQKIGEYKYSSSYAILKDMIPPFLQNSFVLREYPTHELFELLEIPLSEEELENLTKLHQTKYKKIEQEIVHVKSKTLEEHFVHVKSKKERDRAIKNAYEDGYKKSEIAKKLDLSGAGVAKIIKKFRV